MHKIDHFAIGATSLDAGLSCLEPTLGLRVPDGSKHTLMSTHNCVMQAGNESFFELIAIDPDAPAPDRPRWFTLDFAATKKKLAERPRALCWVVSTDRLDEVVANSPVELGEIVTFVRGDRSWRLTVPKDGHLPEGGLLPAFIEWSPGPHPSTSQKDMGVTLKQIQLRHPDNDSLRAVLKDLKVNHLANVEQGIAGLRFVLETPKGEVVLD